ncbi:MAG: hypothetical protein Q4B08_02500 [Propionibacteriaceae bacterium]|nr:hypothetical protein [Propionibacteriaceae bacterium]
MNNVLVFYGFGGVGKSALSVKLEEWVNGGVGCEHWGPSPTGFRVVTARWDLRDTEALKSPVLFYLRLRRAVVGAGVRTPLLDVGIVAMATKFNAGHGSDPDGLLATVPQLADSLLQELFPNLASEEGAGLSSEYRLLDLLTTPGRTPSTDYGWLPKAVTEIMAGEADVESLCRTVKVLGWLLSYDLKRLQPVERPLPVVFVDTFEVLEGVRDEQVVNSALGTLHSCLLVVTGREMVNWAIPRISLPYSGPQVWPSLARTSRADEEPRQHLVGELSVRDAQGLLEAYLGELGLPLADGLCARLAQKARLPIHIDVIVELARDSARDYPGRELTDDDLGGQLERVVERLMERSSPERANLLQASAVSKQFDAPLLAAIAHVNVGVAQVFLSNSLIQKVRDKQHFQYHLHDEVRDIVLAAGHKVVHAWNDHDRRAAAQRGLDRLEREIEAAKQADELERWLLIHGTAFQIATEYGLEPGWVAGEFRRSPSRPRLARILGDVAWGDSKLAQTAYLNAILAKPTRTRMKELEESLHLFTFEAIHRKARLWLAYSYRQVTRYGEALDLLRGLWEERQDRLYAGQYVLTCLYARRYRDAITAWLTWGERAGWPMGTLMEAAGLLDGAVELKQKRLDTVDRGEKSRHWISQLRVALADARCWQGPDAEEDLRRAYLESVLLERLDGPRHYWKWQALWNLFDDARVAECWQQLKRLVNAEGEQPKEERDVRFLVAGMRVLAVGDRGYLDELVGELERLPEWVSVPVEFLYEHLGDLGLVDIGLQAQPTQWVGDREEIKRRWLSILHCVVAEARAKKDAR